MWLMKSYDNEPITIHPDTEDDGTTRTENFSICEYNIG